MNNKINRHINVSIGIPAYNEEKNISKLLSYLITQKETGFKLKEILLVCDGSTDRTVEIANKIKDKRIKISFDKKRLGKSARLAEILRRFSGDVLFLMDADITLKDRLIIEKIIKNINFTKTGLVGVAATPLPATNFFQNVINHGVTVMNDISRHWNNGNNYLSFKGCFLALEKKLAKQSHIKSSLVNNDAYFYFRAIELGYTPKKLENIAAFYQSPKTFTDHLKQSSRYQSSQQELQHYFTKDLTQSYHIPVTLTLVSTIRGIIRNPLYVLCYMAIRVLSKIGRDKAVNSKWDIAVSTKGVYESR